MYMSNSCDITSLDHLSPNKFEIVMTRFPGVQFFTQRVPIPSWTLGQVRRPTNRDKDITYPGDKIEFEDLILSLLLDENMQGFVEVFNWAKENVNVEYNDNTFSDISILIKNHSHNINRTITFYNCFPYNASTILLDATQAEDNPLSTDIIFKYTHYDIT